MRGTTFLIPKISVISSMYFNGMAAFLPNSSKVKYRSAPSSTEESDCSLMPSEMAMAVINGARMAIIQRQTTMDFVLCLNKFSVAKRSKLICFFNRYS